MIGQREESLQLALRRIRQSLDLFASHGLIELSSIETALARVTTSTHLEDAAGAELVIEAVPEDTELKLEIFRRLESTCPPPAILAWRPASSLIARVHNRERVLAVHF